MMRKFWIRFLTGIGGLSLFIAGIYTLPHWWCSRTGSDWFRGDIALQQRLAHGVERWLRTEINPESFATSSKQFNGEWLFGTYLMAGFGFGQTAMEHPEWRAHHLELMDECIEKILTPKVREFDQRSWNNDPIQTLDSDSDHAAYLGYFNLLLSLQRLLDPNSKHAALNDRITETLARRFAQSKILLLQTYPGEVYPVDNSSGIASIALHDRALGVPVRSLVNDWLQRCREKYIDPRSGLLFQAIDYRNGEPLDQPRGSGTFLGAYFLCFADPAIAHDLFEAGRRELFDSLLGFGMVREYPSYYAGSGDIDSGPIVMGYGVSATGFALAASRQHGDPSNFSRLYGTVHLFGAPLRRGDRLNFVSGGPIGDAILFAMLTAQPSYSRKP